MQWLSLNIFGPTLNRHLKQLCDGLSGLKILAGLEERNVFKKSYLAHSSKGSQLRSAPSLRLSVCNNKEWGQIAYFISQEAEQREDSVSPSTFEVCNSRTEGGSAPALLPASC